MTHQASRLIDTVDDMLLGAGQEQDTELRAALLSLGRLASLPAPPPNAQLAALLACRPDDLSWRRRLRRHRPVIVGLAVVAGMGLGVTGVAASASRPAEQASASVQELLEDWAPPWNVSGLPAAAPATGLFPEAAPGKQEAPVRDIAKQPARGPATSPSAPAEAGFHDAGPGAREAAGFARETREPGAKKPEDKGPEDKGQEGKGPADGDQAAGDSAGNGPKVAAEADADAVPDSGQEAARQALEKSAKLLSGGAGKKTDPGAKWLKKFNH